MRKRFILRENMFFKLNTKNVLSSADNVLPSAELTCDQVLFHLKVIF